MVSVGKSNYEKAVRLYGEEIAKELDAKDGKVNGKIKTDIWTEYKNNNPAEREWKDGTESPKGYDPKTYGFGIITQEELEDAKRTGKSLFYYGSEQAYKNGYSRNL